MNKGKRIVEAIIATYLLIVLGEMIYSLIKICSLEQTEYVVSLFISVFISIAIYSVIFMFLYKGKPWAKWLTVILLIWSAFIARNQQHIEIKGYSLFVICVYVISAIVLIYSKNVRIFLEKQRNNRHEQTTSIPEHIHQMGMFKIQNVNKPFQMKLIIAIIVVITIIVASTVIYPALQFNDLNVRYSQNYSQILKSFDTEKLPDSIMTVENMDKHEEMNKWYVKAERYVTILNNDKYDVLIAKKQAMDGIFEEAENWVEMSDIERQMLINTIKISKISDSPEEY